MKVLILLPTLLLSSKPVVTKYEGGSRYHSHLVLTLYRDSTFTYTTWYHSKPRGVSTYKGVWRTMPGKLVLNSRRKQGAFHNESFILKGDTLKLYSEKDSVENYSFYKDYFTLIRTP
jgi:hypothetical protein